MISETACYILDPDGDQEEEKFMEVENEGYRGSGEGIEGEDKRESKVGERITCGIRLPPPFSRQILTGVFKYEVDNENDASVFV